MSNNGHRRMKYLPDLIHWVTERESIRLKREAGLPRPWTDDPILQTYRFCNVRREDDRVTRWIHRNWLFPNMLLPNVEFAMGVARMVNLPETLAEIGFPHRWSPNHFVIAIHDRKASGQKCWTSAYMITGGYSAGGEAKEQIIARVLNGLYSNLNSIHGFIATGDSLEVMHSKILTPGIGSFLAAQIVADIKWLPEHIGAKDWMTWCAPGPGSTLGLQYLFEDDKTMPEELFQERVLEVKFILEQELGLVLDAQNVQNCLCELSKYIRAKYFGKRLKSSYTPDNRPLPAALQTRGT